MQAVTDLAQRRNEALASRTRAAILRATIAVIARHSLSGTTVQLVAEAAKVAPGTVILHFQKKDALLLAALEQIAAEFETARRAALEAAGGDPVKALEAIIEVSLDPKVSDPANVAVWYAFWGEAKARKLYLERIGSYDTVSQEGLDRLFAEIISKGNSGGGYRHLNAEALAMGFSGLLEWQWQEILVSGRNYDREAAKQTARAYLASIFPQEFAPH
ncbi:TetR/AcrR family transcriptional regulator [Dongia sedimenti]|uniref:TetR/AcrR family transcriptional regulator n=1 Tax=Dongia sedimenti TaxID=3064282 RepID=A0ABU0YPP0_9PROT|nr:TetR/AcrR family transcriptional regulator [Rhodospirillaceae bacterium R-7]